MRFIPVLLLLLLSVLLSVVLFKTDSENVNNTVINSPLIGKKMPDFSVPSLNDDSNFDNDDLKGTGVKVLNVWASWCIPCVTEHKYLQQLSKHTPVYGLTYKDTMPNSQKFLSRMGNIYTRIGVDWNGDVALQLGVYGVPETYIIDNAGIIRFKHIGAIDKVSITDIENKIKNLNRGQ